MRRDYMQALMARLFSTVSTVGCGLLSLKVYGLFLEVEIYGVIAVALTVLAYLPMLDGGFRTTTNRALLSQSDDARRRRLIEFAQVFYSCFALAAIAVAVVLMLAYSFTGNPRQTEVSPAFFAVLGLTSALLVFGNAQMGLLVGLNRQAEVFLLMGIQAWLTLGTLTLALAKGMHVWSFPISSVAGAGAAYLIALAHIRRNVSGFKAITFRTTPVFWEEFHRLKGDAIACFRSQVSIVILFTVDIVLVGLVSNAQVAAVYAVLSRLLGIVRGVLQTGSEAAWPVIARSGGTMAHFTAPLLRVNAWAYGSVMGGLLLMTPEFLNRYMGPEWAPPDVLVYLLGARFLVTGVSSPVAFFFYGVGEFKLVARYIELELAVAIVLGALMGWWWGAVGVACGFLAATAMATFWRLLFKFCALSKFPAVSFFAGLWLRCVAAGSLSLGVSLLLNDRIDTALSSVGIGVAAASVAIFGAAIFAIARAAQARDGAAWNVRRVFDSV